MDPIRFTSTDVPTEIEQLIYDNKHKPGNLPNVGEIDLFSTIRFLTLDMLKDQLHWYNVDVNIKLNNNGSNMLLCVVGYRENTNKEIVKFLLDIGVRIEDNNDGFSVLDYAALNPQKLQYS